MLYQFEISYKNTKVMKTKDLFEQFIFLDLDDISPDLNYSVSKIKEDRNQGIYRLEVSDLNDLYQIGYEFASYLIKNKTLNKEIKKLKVIK